MSKIARILAVVFLAVFAAGTAAHAAAATDMSLKMSMASMDAGGDMDCTGCPGDEGQAAACDQFCVTTPAALCAPAGIGLPDGADVVAILLGSRPDGRTGPPEPYPPRTILPS